MINTYKVYRLISYIIVITFFINITPLSFAKKEKKSDKYHIIDLSDDIKLSEAEKYNKRLLPPEKLEKEYEESTFRRFEIVFFLAIPFIIAYQFLLNQLITSNFAINGQRGGKLSGQQWVYMGMSSILVALGVGVSDYLSISGRSDSYSPYSSPVGVINGVNIAFNFYF